MKGAGSLVTAAATGFSFFSFLLYLDLGIINRQGHKTITATLYASAESTATMQYNTQSLQMTTSITAETTEMDATSKSYFVYCLKSSGTLFPSPKIKNIRKR